MSEKTLHERLGGYGRGRGTAVAGRGRETAVADLQAERCRPAVAACAFDAHGKAAVLVFFAAVSVEREGLYHQPMALLTHSTSGCALRGFRLSAVLKATASFSTFVLSCHGKTEL